MIPSSTNFLKSVKEATSLFKVSSETDGAYCRKRVNSDSASGLSIQWDLKQKQLRLKIMLIG